MIKKFKKEPASPAGRKVFIASLEQSKNSMPLKHALGGLAAKLDTALILGNEVKGIPKSVLSKSDAVLEIPMLGKKESLNVSVAAGIALYVLVLDSG